MKQPSVLREQKGLYLQLPVMKSEHPGQGPTALGWKWAPAEAHSQPFYAASPSSCKVSPVKQTGVPAGTTTSD